MPRHPLPLVQAHRNLGIQAGRVAAVQEPSAQGPGDDGEQHVVHRGVFVPCAPTARASARGTSTKASARRAVSGAIERRAGAGVSEFTGEGERHPFPLAPPRGTSVGVAEADLVGRGVVRLEEHRSRKRTAVRPSASA